MASAAASEEHIYLSSDELEEVGARRVDCELEQASRIRRWRQRCAIFNRSYLAIETQRNGSIGADQWLNLAFVDANPQRVRHIARRCWKILAGFSLTFAVALAIHFGVPAWRGPVLLGIIGAGALGSAGSLWLALYRSYDRLVFHTRHGGARVLELLNRPSRKSFTHFVEELQRRIRDAASERLGNRTHYLRDEMKEHRRLAEQGLLSPEVLEQARKRILRAHD